MASKNKKILTVNHNRLVLVSDLIPKDVSKFEYECKADGRIVLTPYSEASQPGRDHHNEMPDKKKRSLRGQVIDFKAGQALMKKRHRHERGGKDQSESDQRAGSNETFVRLHLFPSRLEAEMVGEILKQAEIPFLIQSEDIGIFGPSAAPAPGGARLVVRQTDLDAAKTLLTGLI